MSKCTGNRSYFYLSFPFLYLTYFIYYTHTQRNTTYRVNRLCISQATWSTKELTLDSVIQCTISSLQGYLIFSLLKLFKLMAKSQENHRDGEILFLQVSCMCVFVCVYMRECSKMCAGVTFPGTHWRDFNKKRCELYAGCIELWWQKQFTQILRSPYLSYLKLSDQ